ncbi:hypothetical protein HMPREF9555_00669 [Selenomonas artemidis F0399]|uniref:Uncharacterized protein n=1 Tax=Selenomonas artemidis F0399 TaxID=749551 RepID=E7N118_9FIRM|nr:hypothetical protein HMPREF9555_00669 [Selenomonas artemidis F0399]
MPYHRKDANSSENISQLGFVTPARRDTRAPQARPAGRHLVAYERTSGLHIMCRCGGSFFCYEKINFIK